MSYSIQDASTDLTGVLHGTTTNQIQGLNQLFNRTARQLLLDVDPQETKRITQLPVVYPNVYDYASPADLKGNCIIDIRPQAVRYPRDVWRQVYNQAFDVAKTNYLGNGSPSMLDMFTINFNTAVKTIRLNAPFLQPPPIIVNYADTTTGNGTWAVSGTASNLSVNNVNYIAGGGALQFDMTTGTGTITNSTMSASDLSDFVNQAYAFFYVYLPDGSDITSVSIKWGSSASDYYSRTATTDFQGNAFSDGWNMIGVAWDGASSSGSPDSSAIDYLQVNVIATAAQTAVKVNGFFFALGTILEIEYYSKYLFRSATTGAFQETVTDSSTLINLDTESYNMFFNLAAFFAVQQQQGMEALAYDGNMFGQEYMKCLARYKARYKSEIQKPQTSYYSVPQTNNVKYIGTRWNY